MAFGRYPTRQTRYARLSYPGRVGQHGARMGVSLRRNRRLKKLLAESMLDASTPQGDARKKLLTPSLRKRAVTWAVQEKGYSQRRACGLVGLHPKTYRYASTRPDDSALRIKLKKLASQRRRFGYRRLGLLLARQGTCSAISTKRGRSSKHGGSTTTPTDRTRASTGSHQLSSQHAPRRGITGTDSPYDREQFGEQVTVVGFTGTSMPPPRSPTHNRRALERRLPKDPPAAILARRVAMPFVVTANNKTRPFTFQRSTGPKAVEKAIAISGQGMSDVVITDLVSGQTYRASEFHHLVSPPSLRTSATRQYPRFGWFMVAITRAIHHAVKLTRH